MKIFGLNIGIIRKPPVAKDSIVTLNNTAKKVGIQAVLRAFESDPNFALQYGLSILKIKQPDYAETVFQKIVESNPDLQYKLAETKIQALLGGTGPKSLRDQILELKELMGLVGENRSSGILSPELVQLAQSAMQTFGTLVINANPELKAKITDVAQQALASGNNGNNSGHTPSSTTSTQTPEEIDYTNNMSIIKNYISMLIHVINDDNITPESAAAIALGRLNNIAVKTREFDPEMSTASRINEIIQQSPRELISTLRSMLMFVNDNEEFKNTVDRLSTPEGTEYLLRFHVEVRRILIEQNGSSNNDENEYINPG